MRGTFRSLRLAVVALLALTRYLQRRRATDKDRPLLELSYIHPPSWGAERLALGVRNVGGGTAKDCRYCRMQQFTMAGLEGSEPSFTRRRWYGSNTFSVRSGKTARTEAILTLDDCCREVLDDLLVPEGDEGMAIDAIICRDAAGTCYRFLPNGPQETADRWCPGLLDRLRRRAPPRWAEWVRRSAVVAPISWRDLR